MHTMWPWSWFNQWFDHFDSRLDTITALLNAITNREKKMAIDLTAVTAEVANNVNITNSVVTLLGNLTALIQEIPPSSDPVTQAALDQLTTTLASNDVTIANAVVANTPAAKAKA